MSNVPFIAVEGVISVGKTTLAKEIAKAYQMHLITEIVEENPFLDKFYKNMNDWSFQTEMFFLTHRFKQLETIAEQYINNQNGVVSDYHVFKNQIFAEQTLKPHHLKKYVKIYNILTEDMPSPNLIIYLKASLQTLIKRVKKRNRAIERHLSSTYLNALIQDYDAFIHHYKLCHPDIPLLTFNADQIDFVENKEDLEFILNEVKPYITEHGGKIFEK